ncbi:MAG: glycoside hydrolase 100 family protein [Candidatus Scalindua sp.]|nr:glycoside hydrolase 100 family protein [Candidatus Scalindua sp.]MCR4343629.1 glycoside hydrolase 100 family protein [Candidatus Scalindua sp.]
MTIQIEAAKKAALEVLLYNARGPFDDLPRTAGWGYPEPYTRDLMIAGLGILVSDNKTLIESLDNVLKTMVRNQSPLGHIPSLVNDPENRGASDTTPLFLLTAAIYQKVRGPKKYLQKAIKKALTWMEYQSPTNRALVAQMPTTDWRDEQWVIGFGLYVNTLVYCYLSLFNQQAKADNFRENMNLPVTDEHSKNRSKLEGFRLNDKPYLALWSYKIYNSDRFDLLGNSLAILSGIVSEEQAGKIINWLEKECQAMQTRKQLAILLPPNLLPYIEPQDHDWRQRYADFNKPGEYHNGGIWPFICGFYIAALVAAKKIALAEKKLALLTELIIPARQKKVSHGFNEWFKAQDGTPQGNDWQTWSAAMYLYAAECVDRERTPFFEEVRQVNKSPF